MDLAETARLASLARPSELGQVLAMLAAGEGVSRVHLYLVDYQLGLLQAVSSSFWKASDRPAHDVDRSVAGRAFLKDVVLTEQRSTGGMTIWVPIRERGESLGVMALECDEVGGLLDDGADDLADLGRLVGLLVRSGGLYTDLFEVSRRRDVMNLAAEMQWAMLPPLSFIAPGVQIDGVLEPAYEIGGDGFDYALNDTVAEIAIFDAMGHGLEAAQTVSAAIGAFRYCRRNRLEFAEAATTIDVAISHLYGQDRFVTGQLVQLDTVDRTLRWINAGHPLPMLHHRHRAVSEPTVEPCLPFGLGTQVVEVGQMTLEPGDQLLLLSDGGPEARPDQGEQFGRERLGAALQTELGTGHHPSRVLRRLVEGVQEHRNGALEDDVTFVLVSSRPESAGPGAAQPPAS